MKLEKSRDAHRSADRHNMSAVHGYLRCQPICERHSKRAMSWRRHCDRLPLFVPVAFEYTDCNLVESSTAATKSTREQWIHPKGRADSTYMRWSSLQQRLTRGLR